MQLFADTERHHGNEDENKEGEAADRAAINGRAAIQHADRAEKPGPHQHAAQQLAGGFRQGEAVKQLAAQVRREHERPEGQHLHRHGVYHRHCRYRK